MCGLLYSPKALQLHGCVTNNARTLKASRPALDMRLARVGKSVGLKRRGIQRGATATELKEVQNTSNKSTGTWLVVGLGNPGKKYVGTRHNVGFEAVTRLASQEAIRLDKGKVNTLVGSGSCAGQKIILAQPQSYMNLSGHSVGQLSTIHKIPGERMLVICDDLDLHLGKVRLRAQGGHGGHNGLRSIIQHRQGDRAFGRIRIAKMQKLRPFVSTYNSGDAAGSWCRFHAKNLRTAGRTALQSLLYAVGRPITRKCANKFISGIGRPEDGDDIAGFVLQKFLKSEQPEIEHALDEAVSTIRAVLQHGLEKALSGVR